IAIFANPILCCANSRGICCNGHAEARAARSAASPQSRYRWYRRYKRNTLTELTRFETKTRRFPKVAIRIRFAFRARVAEVVRLRKIGTLTSSATLAGAKRKQMLFLRSQSDTDFSEMSAALQIAKRLFRLFQRKDAIDYWVEFVQGNGPVH